MALNNFVVDAIAGARGLSTTSLIGETKSASAGNALAVLKQQLEKIKNSEALNDSQRAERQRLTADKQDVEKKGSALSALNEKLTQLGNLANQLNGLGGIRAEETKNVKVQKEIRGQKTVTENSNSVTEANLSSEKLTLANADVLFGGSVTPNAQIKVQVQVAQGATNVAGLNNGDTFTAERVGTSNEVRLLDANGNQVNIGGTGTGQQKNISGITLAKTTTVDTLTIQETEEQRRQANLKKIRETFGAFNEQINTVKSFLSENTKEGGALQNDSGAKQLLTELNTATRQLNGLDVEKFVQGAEKSFVQFERIGRTTAQNVANVATRFAGPGSVLGQEVSSLQTQTKGINSQLENLANIEEENRKQLQAAASDITKTVLGIGSQKAFLQKVGNEPNGTTAPRKASSVFSTLPKLPGTTSSIGAGTAAAV